MIQSINRYWGYSVFLIAVYTLNPLCGILLAAFLYYRKEESNGYLYLLFTFMAAYMGVINMTKKPASDMINYISYFNHVPIRDLATNIMDYGSMEPLYGLIDIVGYYLTNGIYQLFFFLLTMLMYMMLFLAMKRLYETAGCNKLTVLCSAFILTFFSLYFVLTAHLVRQVLAMSLVIYAMSYRATTGKNHWIFLASAFLIHSMTGIFVLLAMLPIMYKRLTLKSFVIITSILILLCLFNIQMSRMFSTMTSFSTLNYAINRFGGVGIVSRLSVLVMMVIYLPIAAASARVFYVARYEDKNPLLILVNMQLCLLVFILSFYSNSLIQTRFFMTSYAFVPLILPLLFYRVEKWTYWYSLTAIVFFLVSFFFMYNSSAWSFADVNTLLFMPYPLLFFQSL